MAASGSKPIIKLKPKPLKPTPKKVSEHIYGSEVHLPCTLQEIKDKFKGAELKDISIDIRGNPYDGRAYIMLTGLVPESDESFGKRMKAYETRLETWKKWQQENKELIAQEIQRQKEELQEKQKKEMSKLQAQLEYIEEER